MIWALLVIIMLETVAIAIMSHYTYKMALAMLISKILKIPLFYDSPEIKKTVEDIRRSRDAILYVAKQLTSIQEDEEEIGNEESNKEG